MKTSTYYIRIIILTLVSLLCILLLSIVVLNVQTEQAKTEETVSERVFTRTFTENGARGEIFDRNGVPLVVNEMAFAIEFDYY
ncbi:MAG: hypothetical protein GX633_03655, partial [Clostridiales bacterium]|nr:hypothetical protein [Clostridiales bacterium]